MHGDISRTARETDRITIDLDAGATLELRLTATFQATLMLTDPDAAPYCEYVFFETARQGNPQVWRMAPSGAGQINVTLGDNGPLFWNDALDEVTLLLGYIRAEPGRSVRLPIILK